MNSLVVDQIHKHYERISPGVVGSVGVTNVALKLKHSSPDMPLRYEAGTVGPASQVMGSNVQDGSLPSFDSGGHQARVVDSNWGGRRGFKTTHGWVYQDLRAPDRIMEPVLGSTPRYTWYNKIARAVEAKRTGEYFLPLPGAYEPTTIPRGGQYPRTIATEQPQDQTSSWMQGIVENRPGQDPDIIDKIVNRQKQKIGSVSDFMVY